MSASVKVCLAKVSVGKRVTNALKFISEFPRGRRLFLMIVEDDEASDDTVKYEKIFLRLYFVSFRKVKTVVRLARFFSRISGDVRRFSSEFFLREL